MRKPDENKMVAPAEDKAEDAIETASERRARLRAELQAGREQLRQAIRDRAALTGDEQILAFNKRCRGPGEGRLLFVPSQTLQVAR